MKIFFAILVFAIFALAFGVQANAQTSAAAESSDDDLLAKFDAVDKGAAGKKFVWTGTWKYNSRYAPVSLKITAVKARSFDFEVDSATGANIGHIGGTAQVKGSKAFYDDTVTEEGVGCQLLFINRGGSIEIKQTSECNDYAGAGVYFERETLLKGNPPVLEKDLSDHKVFPTPAMEAKFKALVGAAEYENFLDAFHLVSEDDDSDGLGVKSFTGCVRGVCPWKTAIIMHDGKGRIWAAVLTDDSSKKQRVNYYTNVPAWASKLPETIAKWAGESNGKMPVVYKNKAKAK